LSALARNRARGGRLSGSATRWRERARCPHTFLAKTARARRDFGRVCAWACPCSRTRLRARARGSSTPLRVERARRAARWLARGAAFTRSRAGGATSAHTSAHARAPRGPMQAHAAFRRGRARLRLRGNARVLALALARAGARGRAHAHKGARVSARRRAGARKRSLGKKGRKSSPTCLVRRLRARWTAGALSGRTVLLN
jgi:hypothetical protein